MNPCSRSWLVLSFCFAASLPLAAADAGALGDLESVFRDPPVSARPYVWWHWMGPNFSQAGITRDLEAMRDSGVGGATIFNITSMVHESHTPTENNPWPGQTYRGPAYWAAIRHAASEAKRLGLELGLHNTPGYSTTGGPWIDEERGMQRLLWSEEKVNGGRTVSVTLPVPAIPPYRGWGASGAALRFHRDVALLAVPSGREAGRAASPGEVVDLSAKGRLEGDVLKLTWEASPGEWTLYRFVHAPTGASPHPVPDDLFGRVLEADKISLTQTRFHWEQVLDPVRQHLGPLFGDSFRHVLIDSYEAKTQNWTPGFREEFLRRKGYDPLPWLVTLGPPITGVYKGPRARVLGSEADTVRFEWDYDDVVATLFQENGWAAAARLIHDAGLTVQFEPYFGPFDTVAATTVADLPMVEFWTGGEGEVLPAVSGAARAAGIRLLGAEAFTGRPETSGWTETPAFLKRSADGAFASGVNRMVLHHWVHQPFDDRHQPGMGMGWWGTHFGRHQTWAEPGKAFFRYLGRVQALLQRGETPVRFVSVGRPSGGDVIPRAVLRAGLRVEDGQVVLPSGRRYAFLHVPHEGALLPEELREIKRLLELGAHVVALRPSASPSLAGQPAADEEVRALGAELWGADGAPQLRAVGRGFLHTHGKPELALDVLRLEPFFGVEDAQAAAKIRVHHRREGDVDLFFVANMSLAPVDFRFLAQVRDRLPELWNAETGEISPAAVWSPAGDRTRVTLSLAATKSVFVVFRRAIPANSRPLRAFASETVRDAWSIVSDAAGSPVLLASAGLAGKAEFGDGVSREVTVAGPPAPVALDGSWAVGLAPKLGASSELGMDALVSLSERPEPEARYFSGTATYRNAFVLPAVFRRPGLRLRLDLGEVRDLARVTLNGRDLDVLWHPPFVLDVTDVVRPGENTLEIAVTNTWHNRLVGDERHPADFEFGLDRGPVAGRGLKGYPEWFLKNQPRPSSNRVGFVTWFYHRSDTPLLPAGLLGPVRLVPLTETRLSP